MFTLQSCFHNGCALVDNWSVIAVITRMLDLPPRLRSTPDSLHPKNSQIGSEEEIGLRLGLTLNLAVISYAPPVLRSRFVQTAAGIVSGGLQVFSHGTFSFCTHCVWSPWS